MAEFDRKALRKIFEDAEIEVPKDVLGQICNLHTTSNEDLTESVKTLKADLEKAERERDAYKAKAPKDGVETVSKEDFDKLQKEYDDYKADVTAQETKRTKEHAIREFYKGVGISEKRIDSVVRIANLDEFELDKDGKIKDADKHTEKAKKEWADFITTQNTQFNNPEHPPANNGGAMTKKDIMNIKDDKERLSAIEKYPELFVTK